MSRVTLRPGDSYSSLTGWFVRNDGEVTLMLDPEREAVSAHAVSDGALERERAAREADAIAQNPERTPSEQAVARVIAKRIREGGP